MPVAIIERINAGPPTRGSSMVLISGLLTFGWRSGRYGPGLNSPLRNLGNKNFAIQLKIRLSNAHVIKVNNNQIGIISSPLKNVFPELYTFKNLQRAQLFASYAPVVPGNFFSPCDNTLFMALPR